MEDPCRDLRELAVERGEQVVKLQSFRDTLVAAAEMPEDLEPSQVTPWFVRLIVAAKKSTAKTDDLDARDVAEFRAVLEEIAKSPWSPDEAAVARAALEASEKRRKSPR